MLLLAGWLSLSAAIQFEKKPPEHPVLPQFYVAPTKGPTLSNIDFLVEVKGQPDGSAGTVSLPVPLAYSGQVLVSLELHCDPPTALKAWNLETRPDRLNAIVVANLVASSEPIKLGYSAKVMCPSEPVVRTQVTEFHPWLRSTPCVQSEDPAIKELASRLKQGTKDQDDFVEKVVTWVAKNKTLQSESISSRDAKSGLEAGGDSLNRSNLCAAILRATGIAARSVAHLPTWAISPIFEHWLVEYWSDEGNWQMVEPTLGVQHPARNSVVVLSIATTDEEVAGSNGIPYLSIPTLASAPNWALNTGAPTNTIRLIRSFPPQSEARLMTAAYRRSLRVFQAAVKGQSSPITDAQVQNALRGGLNNLALLLDGKLEAHQQ